MNIPAKDQCFDQSSGLLSLLLIHASSGQYSLPFLRNSGPFFHRRVIGTGTPPPFVHVAALQYLSHNVSHILLIGTVIRTYPLKHRWRLWPKTNSNNFQMIFYNHLLHADAHDRRLQFKLWCCLVSYWGAASFAHNECNFYAMTTYHTPIYHSSHCLLTNVHNDM